MMTFSTPKSNTLKVACPHQGVVRGSSGQSITTVISFAAQAKGQPLAAAMAAVASLFDLKSAATAAIAMVAIGIAVIAMQKAVDAGSKINAGAVGKAFIGVLAASALLATGMVAFAIALHVIGPFFRGLDWKGLAIGFVALAIVMAATAGVIYLASLVPAAMITMAAANVATASLFVLALGLFSTAMIIASIPILRTPWVKLIIPLLAIAAAMGTMVVTALAAIALGALSVPASYGLGMSVLFIAAMGIFSVVMSKIAPKLIKLAPSMKTIAKFFAITAVALGAMILTEIAAIAGGILAIPATIGIALMSGFVMAVAWGFVPALEYFKKKSEKVPFVKMAIEIAKLAIIVGAFTIGAYALAAALPALAVGIVGVAVLSFFVLAMSAGFIPSLQKFKTGMEGLGDLKNLAVQSGYMVLISAALALVGFAFAAGTAAFLIGIFGIMAAGVFIEKLNSDAMPHLVSFAGTVKTNASTFQGAEPGLKALGQLMTVLGDTAALAKALMVFKLPFIGNLMMGGLEMVATFTAQIKQHIVPAVKDLATMEIQSSGDLTAKIDAVGAVVEMIAKLGGVAVQLADADTSAMDEGGAQGAALTASGNFVKTLFTGVKEIIDKITSVEMDPAQIRSAAAVGKVLGAIGEMMSSLAPDPELIKALQTTTKTAAGPFSRTKTETNTEAISAVADYLKTVMGTIAEQIPIMFDAVMSAANSVSNPGAAEKKIAVIAKAFSVIGSLASAIKDVMGIVPKMENPSEQAEAIREVINTVSQVLFGSDGGTPGALQKAFAGLKAIISSVTDAEKFGPKVDAVAKAFGVIGAFADAIGKISSMMPKKVGGSEDMGPRIAALVGPDGLVTKIVDALSGDEGMLAKVFNSLKKMVDSLPETGGEAFMQKVKAVGDMFGIVGSFANAVSKVSGVMKLPEGEPPDSGKLMDYVGGIVDGLVGGRGGGAMKKLATGLNGLLKEDAVLSLIGQQRNLTKLGKTFEVVGKFSEAMSSLSSIGGGGDAAASAEVERACRDDDLLRSRHFRHADADGGGDCRARQRRPSHSPDVHAAQRS